MRVRECARLDRVDETLRRLGHVPVRRPRAVVGYLRLLGAGIVSATVGWMAATYLPAPPGWAGQLALLSAAGAAAVGSFVAIGCLLGDRTLSDLRRM